MKLWEQMQLATPQKYHEERNSEAPLDEDRTVLTFGFY